MQEGFDIASEEDLIHSIEALRGKLKRQIGEEYDPEKVQAASTASAQLDRLICRWLRIQEKNRSTDEQA